MGRSRKSKRLTWASDDKLCQVIFYSQELAPSEVGDNLPPGFKRIKTANVWRVKLSQIPLMKWRCPPSFIMDSEWNVVAGEGSKEIEVEKHRQMRVLEAIYPRPSYIPPNPVASLDVADANADDCNTLIPIKPIEEDSTTEESSSNNRIPTTPAFASVMPNGLNNDNKTLIDPHLLMEILKNRKLAEQLVNSHHKATSSSVSAPNRPSTSSLYVPNKKPSLNPALDPMVTPDVSMAMVPPSGPVYHPTQIQTKFILKPHTSAEPCIKDVNYYKKLIQEHGGDRDKHQEPSSLMKSKTRKRKPCMYFNGSKGCRNGANCLYQHIRTSPQRFSGNAKVKSSKRMTLDGEIPTT